MFCNEAAVCAPCVGDQFCGDHCINCTASPATPFCVHDPAAMPGGDPDFCAQCRDDNDCKTGQKCVSHTCQSVCQCCLGEKCAAIDEQAEPKIMACMECSEDGDCLERGGLCDKINRHCVSQIPQHNSDTDCQAGTYCRSGDCVPCTHDRHCGPSCQACGFNYTVGSDGKPVASPSDKPFCLTPDNDATKSTCGQCLTDANCGTGTCDRGTHTCVGQQACAQACQPGFFCNGGSCVQCVTSSQCPCGACVDGLCTQSCGDTTDCRRNQCCATASGTCTDTRCEPNLHAGAGLCCSAATGSVGVANDPATPPQQGRLLLSMLALVGVIAGLRLRALHRLRAAAARGGA
jgi:hypothetical protein